MQLVERTTRSVSLTATGRDFAPQARRLLTDLAAALTELRESGKALRHMVFMLNNNAKRFYERLGFVTIEDLGAYQHMEWKAKE